MVVNSNSANAASPVADDRIERAKTAWEDFLRHNFLQERNKGNYGEAKIEKIMRGKYRDRAKSSVGGLGIYSVFYMLDDYHEVEFVFTRDGKCSNISALMPKRAWLRYPDGSIAHVEK